MKKASLLFAVAIVTEFVFFSCGGGGGGGASGGTSSNDTGTVPNYVSDFTSTDAANGYFNINGGQYRTITFNGTQQSGTVTLSNGTGANLTGTYGEVTSSRAAISQSRVADASKLKGYFWIKFDGQTIGYNYTVRIVDHTIVIRGEALDGSIMHYAGSGSNDTIIPGSAEDPFNGTSWGTKTELPDGTVYSTSVCITFENGKVSGLFFDRDNSTTPYDIDYSTDTLQYNLNYSRQNSYIVSKIAGGYKASILGTEKKIKSSANNQNFDYWSVAWYTIIIENKNSETCNFGVDVHSWNNINGDADVGAGVLPLKKL